MKSAGIGSGHGPRIAYIGSTLPCRSETFVYREVLGLRELGLPVDVVSVHRPERDLGDVNLEALAREAVVLYGGGAIELIRDVAAEMIRHPWRAISTLALAIRDLASEKDVRAFGRAKILVQAFIALALARRLRPRCVTHLHAHMAHVATTIAMYTARQMGVRFSFTGHAADLFRDRALLSAKLRRAAFTACISEWHRSFYRRIVDMPQARLPLVRCGVDTEVFTPINSGTVVTRILAVGRLVPKKGFDVLFRALSALERKGHRFRCDLVGDGPEKSRLERLRQDLGLVESVRMRGALSNGEIRDKMQRAGLLVLPCRVARDGDRDGIPVVLMEAMASGMLAVTGDLPTIRELVLPGETGIVVKSGDVDALVAALEAVLKDPDGFSAMREAGRCRVEAEFTLALNLERMRSALAGETSRAPAPGIPAEATV